MRLATFESSDNERVGAICGEYIIDLNVAYSEYLREEGESRGKVAGEGLPPRMRSFVEAGEAAIEAAKIAIGYAKKERFRVPGAVLKLQDARLRPPVPDPPKIICIGLNYEEYRSILGVKATKVPTFFLKASSTLVGHGDTVRIPKAYGEIYHEFELAVVIGKCCKRVAKKDAKDFIFGYTVFSDITAHDLEQIPPRRYREWGKNFDTFGPMGPWIVTSDEMPDVDDLRIARKRNGKLERESNTKNMRFQVDDIVSFLSSFMTLEAATIISTASPPAGPIECGDTIEVEIEGIGVLANTVGYEESNLDYVRILGLHT